MEREMRQKMSKEGLFMRVFLPKQRLLFNHVFFFPPPHLPLVLFNCSSLSCQIRTVLDFWKDVFRRLTDNQSETSASAHIQAADTLRGEKHGLDVSKKPFFHQKLFFFFFVLCLSDIWQHAAPGFLQQQRGGKPCSRTHNRPV